MPSVDRDHSRDSERHLRHQPGASIDTSRAVVPMWDSSDPERAPPPLPMNPSSPSVASRPNTSSAIQSAHAALTEKARESAYITNPSPKRIEPSPERSLIKGATHKRMQSLQTGNVRDLSSFLEGGSLFGPPKSPEKITRRPPTPHEKNKDFFADSDSPEKPQEKERTRSTTPTQGRETPTRDMPSLRPSLRRPPQSILGENTPPQSATMLALQNMTLRDMDTPLSNVTNGSTALVRTPQTFDAISNQILSLTSIATNLQREMAALSRRSKDNATDLVSLKEATNARDEDIRKSLRELVSGLSETGSRASSAIYGNGALYLDSKAYNAPGSKNVKPFSLPRIPSPNSFAASLDRESIPSPCAFSPDGTASIALLEKVLREMGTREGQETMLARLGEIADSLSQDGTVAATRLEEVLQFIKSNRQQAIVPQKVATGNSRPRNYSFDKAPVLELDFDAPNPSPLNSRVDALIGSGGNKENQRNTSRGSDILSEELLKIIRGIKDSVAQGGGLTAEVKALVRELRGEVLGMGREIGRKLDQASTKDTSAKDAAKEKEHVARIINDGLDELKGHMDHIMQESHRQSASAIARNAVDYQEIYKAMRAAISEKPREARPPDLGKDEIIEAVKEAWENYKPDIELQHFGLEREELLACLKEGIQQYAPQGNSRDIGGATREEVFTAVVEGLKHFSPPRIQNEALSREEILDTVRECLEEFEFPAAPAPEPREPDFTREDMLDAVREGLHTFDFPVPEPKEPDFTREEMLDAVKEGLQTFDFSAANSSALTREVVDGATRDNMLNAVKEGLHTFDFPIAPAPEPREPDFTREDMLDAVREGLHTFDFPAPEPKEPDFTREEMLEAVKEGLQTFDFSTVSSLALARDVVDGVTRDDMLDAVKEGLYTFDFPAIPVPEPKEPDFTREEMLDAVKEGLQSFDFSAISSTALTRDIVEGLTRDNILDAIKEGLHTFDFPAIPVPEIKEPDFTREDMLNAIKEGLQTADFSAVSSTALTRDVNEGLTRDDMLDAVKEGLHTFDFPAIPEVKGPDFTREDMLDAIKEGLQTADFSAVSSTALTRDVIEGLTRDDMLDAVKEGLHTFDFPAIPVPEIKEPDFTREDMLNAIKEGLQTADFSAVSSTALTRDVNEGLTRDDMLDAVKEGLYTFDFPAIPVPEVKGPDFTREDMLDAIKEGLQTADFSAVSSIALTRDVNEGLTRDDMLDAVKEGLHTFDFPPGTASARDVEGSVTREEVLEAVKEGLHTFDFAEVNPSREDVVGAVKEGLETFEFPANGATREDILDAIKEGLHTLDFPATTSAISREDILEAIKDGINNSDFGSNSTALAPHVGAGLTREDVFDAVKSGLAQTPLQMDPFGDQILEKLHDVMKAMKVDFKAVSDEAKQNVSAHGRDTEQVLDATKDGFEKLRSDIESYVDRAADVTAKDEILDSINLSFITLRGDVEALLAQKSDTSMDTVRGELEHLRETMATSLVRSSGNVDRDEILEALRDGLESIRADIDQPRDSNESVLSGTGEILDALHDGLANLRGEVEKVHNKPVDMTVNYEILDTLKAGLEGIRGDIDRLRENGYGDQAVAEVNDRAVVAVESLKRNDIENLEVLIAQIRIKVEAFESMPPQPAEPVAGSLCKDDLISMEEKLAHVQESVAGMLNREPPVDEDSVKRDDIEAIETLLRNTKAKIDEIDPEQTVKKEHLDAVEVLLFETRESVNELKTHLDDVTKRDDITMVEGLLRGVVEGLDEMKERMTSDAEDHEKVTKMDVEAVEAVCVDLKAAIEQRVLPDIAELASKADVKTLSEMVKEFNGRIENHANTNAKAFEERQAETVGVGERVTEIKVFLGEFKDALKEKMEEGSDSIETLGKFLQSMGETIGQNANITDDIKEMFETMKVEFEKSNAGVVGSKLESDEKFQMTWDKFDGKIDEKFNELMTKYDDAEIAADLKSKAGEEKYTEIAATMLGTKAVAEDLKLLIDTLGITLTDSVEKMDEASKTVFNRVEETFGRVEETFNKVDGTSTKVDETFKKVDQTFNRVDETFSKVEETYADAKAEHQLTRDQVFKSIGAIEGVQGHVTEYHPKILESIKNVLFIVGQHYEHSKASTTTIQEKIAEIPPPPPPIELPLLRDVPEVEKYDDTPVHEKLDKLVDHMHAAGKSFAQLDILDKIHQQVMQTAAEVSEFVSVQTKRISDDHEDKEKAVQDATIALEKQLAQKEHIEVTVVGLREEERHLKESVSILKAEQEDLAHQKMRYSADVSSLETALRIRREELHAMETRVEGLERRILEGVIDHSRALLISKSNKGRDAMSRKRVPSHATSTTGSVVSSSTRTNSRASYTSNTTQSAVNMAMGGNRAMVSAPVNNSAGASRRILSLNQITHNVPTGGVSRSHSVKAPGRTGALRKSSWGGSLSQKYGDLNKENLALKESEEDDASDPGDDVESEEVRRSSLGTTILTSNGTGVTESTIDEGTEWTGSIDGDEESHIGDDTATGDPAQVVLYEEAGEVA